MSRVISMQKVTGEPGRTGLLNELPAADFTRRGWPWTEESDRPQGLTPDGRDWPRITIVTPSYNQGRFLEETIRSVLLQNYPNLEYIVLDGGSTDGSLEIIRKYEKWIDYWVSEPDGGQSAAINAGMQRATGELANWLNSDDVLARGALRDIALAYLAEGNAVAWAGVCSIVDEAGQATAEHSPRPGSTSAFANWGAPDDPDQSTAWVGQPSCFFRRSDFLAVGGLDPALHYTMDVELWMKLAAVGRFHVLHRPLSCARIHPDIKSLQDYPSRMVEHVVIGWNHGEKTMAREKLLEFCRREFRNNILSLGLKDFMLFALTWFYRRGVGVIARLAGRR